MKRTVAKKAADVSNEAEMSTLYWFSGNVEIDMEQRNVSESETETEFLRMSLFHATLEKLKERLRKCGRISITTKVVDDSVPSCFQGVMEDCCDSSEGEVVSIIKQGPSV